jgi:hypothetical protein
LKDFEFTLPDAASLYYGAFLEPIGLGNTQMVISDVRVSGFSICQQGKYQTPTETIVKCVDEGLFV